MLAVDSTLFLRFLLGGPPSSSFFRLAFPSSGHFCARSPGDALCRRMRAALLSTGDGDLFLALLSTGEGVLFFSGEEEEAFLLGPPAGGLGSGAA